MKYELTKKLYDAGFPGIKTWTTHNYVGDFETQIDCTQCGDSVKLQGGTLITGYNMDCPKGEAKYSLPTLAELIEACVNKEEFGLFYYPPSRLIPEDACWSADYGNKSSSLSLGEVGGDYSANGSTPEEAVANLYLELNKKDI